MTAIRRHTRRVKELDREIAALVEEHAPALLELEGCGPLTAARPIAETAGAGRFASDAKFARLAGVAPMPASSGDRTRHRLDRIAVTQGRCHAPAQEFLARKEAEGKSRREALRCLKRHLARRVWRLLLKIEREIHRHRPHSERLAGPANCGGGLT